MKNILFSLILSLLALPITTLSQSFDNPIAERRADPWVHRTEAGEYYLIATVPEYDRIVIRKASSIHGLKTATEEVVWRKHEKGVMSHHIWAPELHRIDGVWYIYFAAGEVGNIWNIRMWVLSNTAADPMEGEWKEEGQIITKKSSFSLDATTFEHQGKRYLIWAQAIWDDKNGTSLLMAEMKSPTSLQGPEIVLTSPEYAWETQKYNVNEGPTILKKNGKIFLTYSASATNHHYCMGMLWIDEHADLMKPANWHKSPAPVFHSNPKVGRFGPGHNSFTLAEDGETVIMIYHARNYEAIEGHELSDPNRATRARRVWWTESGWPDFRQGVRD